MSRKGTKIRALSCTIPEWYYINVPKLYPDEGP